ncbi:N-6 DNA methylase [Natrinema salinisoli]|uniref:N-6 DNA methylase n=1 Tax=Natrinema salinisoli TaxID=2878535 RepID=UPI001CF08591|nr:N-6 DNA methylase [Natrinema salinisoli]
MPVTDALTAIEQQRYSRHNVFDDWLDLMLYALQRRDDPYLEIVEQYDNDRPEGNREIDYFTEAFAQLQQGMAATDADLLGVIYEAYGQSSDAFGQYFTPHNVSDAMAAMNLDDVDSTQYSQDDPLTVADPACGSGRMLISAAQAIPDDVEAAVFYGQDKDPMCGKMTALNLCLFNVDGYAVLGDSLRVEARRLWQTRSSPFGGSVRELDPEEYGNPFEAALSTSDTDDEQIAEDDISADSPALDAVDVELRQATFDEYGGDTS